MYVSIRSRPSNNQFRQLRGPCRRLLRRPSCSSLPVGLPAQDDGGLDERLREVVDLVGAGVRLLRGRAVLVAVARYVEVK